MLAFSTVDRDSFEAIESWKRKVRLKIIFISAVFPFAMGIYYQFGLSQVFCNATILIYSEVHL